MANPAGVELYGEAQAVVDGVDDLPRAGEMVVGQFGVMAVAVERGARLLDQNEVSDGSRGTTGSARDPGVVAVPQFVLRLVPLLQDLLRC